MNCYFRLSPIKDYLKMFITLSNIKTGIQMKKSLCLVPRLKGEDPNLLTKTIIIIRWS